MNYLFILLLSSLTIVMAAGANADTLFKNVMLVDPTSGELSGPSNVLISQDRIQAITEASSDTDQILPVTHEVNESRQVIDASGHYLMAGLVEMHGHIPSLGRPQQDVDDVLFLYLSNGVTTVRGMLGSPGQLSLRAAAKQGAIYPTLYLAGPSFNGNSISSPEQAVARVEQQFAEGWDLLKVHPGLSRSEYDAMASASRRLGIPFAGHVPEAVGLRHALQAGQLTIDHMDGYLSALVKSGAPAEAEGLRQLARETLAANVAVVPTSALWATIIGANSVTRLNSFDELRYVKKTTLNGWSRSVQDRYRGEAGIAHRDARRELLRVLAEEGVPILFGTDAPQLFSVPGFSIHREIDEMLASGLSPQEILYSASVAPGQHLSGHDLFGKIEAGYRADLILLEDNPLVELTALKSLKGVMVRGIWLSNGAIKQRLDSIETRGGAL